MRKTYYHEGLTNYQIIKNSELTNGDLPVLTDSACNTWTEHKQAKPSVSTDDLIDELRKKYKEIRVFRSSTCVRGYWHTWVCGK